jgi:hypothetical protein
MSLSLAGARSLLLAVARSLLLVVARSLSLAVAGRCRRSLSLVRCHRSLVVLVGRGQVADLGWVLSTRRGTPAMGRGSSVADRGCPRVGSGLLIACTRMAPFIVTLAALLGARVLMRAILATVAGSSGPTRKCRTPVR